MRIKCFNLWQTMLVYTHNILKCNALGHAGNCYWVIEENSLEFVEFLLCILC